MRKRFFTIILMLFIAGKAYGGGSEFLRIVPGARSTGMGGVGVALSMGCDSMHLNPAALYPSMEKSQVLFSHVGWWQSLAYEYAAFLMGLGKIGVVAGSFSYFSMPELELTNIYGTPTGELLQIYDMMVDVSCATKITKRVSLGVNLKTIRRMLGSRGANAFSSDFGLFYGDRRRKRNGDFLAISLGAVAQNLLATGIYFDDPGQLDEFPVIVKVGAAISPARLLNLALDFDFPEGAGMGYHAGMEFFVSEIFCVRTGYEKTDDFGFPSGICFGFSYKPDSGVEYGNASGRAKKIMIMGTDYSVRLSGNMGTVHRISFKIDFESKKRRVKNRRS